MRHKRHLYAGYLAALVMLGIGAYVYQKKAVVEAAAVQAPSFEVDPMWPKPLPNHWVMGSVIGMAVDANDHIWLVHRQGAIEPKERYLTWDPPAAECCTPAPPVLEFNEAGDLIGHWGGPGQGYDWPSSNHGITVDYKGNVWIGGNGIGGPAPATGNPPRAGGAAEDPDAGNRGRDPFRANDSMILKFTQSGKFLMQIGKPNESKGSNDTANLRRPTKGIVDPKTNELYVADGYGNKRVIVYDADTGAYKRHWGAYGNKPDDKDLGPYKPDDPPAQQFRSPVHCVELANDGLLYVCDRANDRIQVFKTDGTFVKEQFIAKNTLGDGSAFDIALSKDPRQKYIFMADGSNMKVRILDRDSLELLTSFGDGGRQPGSFYAPHSIAIDSKGNLFIGETYRGQRIQKFLYKGLAAVSAKEQGVVWPKRSK